MKFVQLIEMRTKRSTRSRHSKMNGRRPPKESALSAKRSLAVTATTPTDTSSSPSSTTTTQQWRTPTCQRLKPSARSSSRSSTRHRRSRTSTSSTNEADVAERPAAVVDSLDSDTGRRFAPSASAAVDHGSTRRLGCTLDCAFRAHQRGGRPIPVPSLGTILIDRAGLGPLPSSGSATLCGDRRGGRSCTNHVPAQR